jgi:hypothetical protein
MKKSIRKILVWINLNTTNSSLFLTLIVASCFACCQSRKSTSGINTVESTIDSVDFIELNSRIYISARVWGITGNHEQISIYSNSSLDSIKIYTSEGYFKKVRDTLTIYVPQSAIPAEVKKYIGKVKVHLISLGTQEEVNDYNANYLKYGLTKISAIKE